ncbi:MAG: hypothetical protein LBR20_04740, partial [Propionibacteriaceae bacterium]|nr:hypothetical protein [Propionibacteriaceae bacterium]
MLFHHYLPKLAGDFGLWLTFTITIILGIALIALLVVRPLRRRVDPQPASAVYLIVVWVPLLIAIAPNRARVQAILDGLGLGSQIDKAGGFLMGAEVVLWLACLTQIGLALWRRRQGDGAVRLPAPVIALAGLWVLLIVSSAFSFLDAEPPIAAGLGTMILLALAVSGLSLEQLAFHVRLVFRSLIVASLLYWWIAPAAATWAGQPGPFGDRVMGLTHHVNYLGLIAALALIVDLASLSRKDADPTPSSANTDPTPSSSSADPTPSSSSADPTPSSANTDPTPSSASADPTPSSASADPNPSSSSR